MFVYICHYEKHAHVKLISIVKLRGSGHPNFTNVEIVPVCTFTQELQELDKKLWQNFDISQMALVTWVQHLCTFNLFTLLSPFAKSLEGVVYQQRVHLC